MTDKPHIEIRPQTVCCPAHGEHLRANWPEGFAVVSLTLLRAALENDELVRTTDPEWDGEDGHGRMDENRINEVLADRPLCYWVDRATIRRAFMESGVGRLGKCRACRRRDLGGAYSISTPTGIDESWLCFSCMLDAGDRLHGAHPNGRVWPTEASS